MKFPLSTDCAKLTLSLMMLGVLGCSTVPDPYIPQQVGTVRESSPREGLVLHISTHQNFFEMGVPVEFLVSIRNSSTNAFWVSRHPQMIFYWVYPNGIRDNYVREYPTAIYYKPEDVVLLPPNQQMVFTEVIDTFYFPKPGIVEFRAVYFSSSNTNSRIAPFWQGTLISNSYGVEIKPRRPVRSDAVQISHL